jgi:hypothetical protein
MSEHAFDQKIKAIEEQAGQLKTKADAYRDQELSRLFLECRWTQERIGEKMGRSQGWVSTRLVFGRFLIFIRDTNNSGSLMESLTETGFRRCWTKTTGTENVRFEQVAAMLIDASALVGTIVLSPIGDKTISCESIEGPRPRGWRVI